MVSLKEQRAKIILDFETTCQNSKNDKTITSKQSKKNCTEAHIKRDALLQKLRPIRPIPIKPPVINPKPNLNGPKLSSANKKLVK